VDVRRSLVLLIVASAVSAGCAGASLTASRADAPAYRCSPKGRYGVPEAMMSCFASSPKPGEVLEMDLTPWEYLF
jgi:hypothetical protein